MSTGTRRGLYRQVRGRRKGRGRTDHRNPPLPRQGLTPYLERFLEWCAVKGLTEATVKTRRHALERFVRWCASRDLVEPGTITRPVLEAYQRHLFHYRKDDGSPLSWRSQNSLLTALKMFFKWLTREGHIGSNPASELELPRLPRRLPKTILSVEEVARVLALADTTTPYGVRDRAILETFYSTGLRRMELARLSLYDLNVDRATVTVREGKGRKDRMVPIGNRALYWVQRYLDEVRPVLAIQPDDGTLFLTDYGEAWIQHRLTHLVRKYLYHAGIDKPGACHLFRHAMATHMLENGADIRFIQAMLGHAELSTTQIYTHVSIEKLREIHAATHPADRSREGTP